MPQTFMWSYLWRPEKNGTILDILGRTPLFADLAQKDLKAIERILHRRSYHAGEYIFRAGELGVGMYIIEKGTIAILAEKTDRVLSVLKDGEFFGEMALLHEEPRNAHAIARTDASVFGFFQPDLLALLDRKPRLGVSVVMKLATVISRRLQEAISENEKLFKRITSASSEGE